MNISYYRTLEHAATIGINSKKIHLVCDKEVVENRVLLWENGNLYDNYILNAQIFRREYAYCHFSKRSFSIENEQETLIESFIITPNGIMTKYSHLNIDNIIKYSEIAEECKSQQPDEFKDEFKNALLKAAWKKYLKMKN